MFHFMQINRVWLQATKVSNFGAGFFAFSPAGRTPGDSVDWRTLRDRWEYSHIARAGLAFLSFFSLLLAIVQD